MSAPAPLPQPPAKHARFIPSPRGQLVLILFAATLFIGGMGAVTYHQLRQESLQATARLLAVIAEEKRVQIENWVAQTRTDAKLYFDGTSLLQMLFGQWLAGGRHNEALLAQMQAHLAEVARERGWQGVALYDTDGHLVFKLGEVDPRGHAEAIREVLRQPHIEPIDLHRNAQGTAEYGVLAPLGVPTAAPLGVAHVSWRADQTLYPLISGWPIPTRSAETYLVRREGDQVRYLTPLRHRQDAALALTQPWKAFYPIADYASQRLGDIVENTRDYRGVPIMAYLTAIAGTPWLMIATIDHDEVYAGIRPKAWTTSLITGLALLLMYGAGYLVWRRELAGLRARQAAEERLHLATEGADVGIWNLDLDTGQEFRSERCQIHLGGRPGVPPSGAGSPTARIHPVDRPNVESRIQRALEHREDFVVEYRVTWPDGSERWISRAGRIYPGTDGSPARIAGITLDITARKEAERTILDQQNKFRRLIQFSPIPLGLMGKNGAVVFCNDRFTALFGYTAADIPTRDRWYELAYPDATDRCRAHDSWSRAVQRGIANNAHIGPIEYQVTCKGGARRQVKISGINLDDGVLTAFVDVTERKQQQEALRQRESLLRLFIDHAPVALAMLDRERRYLAVSRRWLEVCHLDEANLRGLSHPELLKRVLQEIPPHWKQTYRRALAGEAIVFKEDHFTGKDGTVHWVHWEARPWRTGDDAVGGIVLFSEDITERKRSERELERYRQHLEELVQSRTLELIEARDAADTANRAKSDFLAHMTHELRTPLHAILGFTDILAKLEDHDRALTATGDGGDEADRNRGKLCAHIRRNSRHLLDLVNDVLDLSRLERGGLTLDRRPTALHTLLHECVDDLIPLATDKGLALRLEIAPGLAPWVRVDRRRLRQVLNNLLGNAVKFTGQGEVRLQAATTPDPDAPGQVTLRFTVGDTGPGIPAAAQDRVFDAFVQAAPGSPQGSGLGLAISRQLIRQMGGEIGLDSEPGRGSRFTLTIPAVAVSDPADDPERPTADEDVGPRRSVVARPTPVTTAAGQPLAAPPLPALAELRELADLGRTTRIEDWCRYWSAPGRRPAFSAQVLKLADNFDHGRIIALVDDYVGDSRLGSIPARDAEGTSQTGDEPPGAPLTPP